MPPKLACDADGDRGGNWELGELHCGGGVLALFGGTSDAGEGAVEFMNVAGGAKATRTPPFVGSATVPGPAEGGASPTE